ncbi:excisionase family DNA-binding protein [Flavobacteriaceae bacterium D16]|nr:excisionase family DNA-binding protein [Flavobacteriaceae bacterium D16]
MNSDIINKKELSNYLGVSIGKIDSLMKSGLPYFKIGRIVRFKKEVVDDYLNDQLIC